MARMHRIYVLDAIAPFHGRVLYCSSLVDCSSETTAKRGFLWPANIYPLIAFDIKRIGDRFSTLAYSCSRLSWKRRIIHTSADQYVSMCNCFAIYLSFIPRHRVGGLT
jgi:hypothetical protein